ncbi:MAG: DUF6754 domain-containing protein [Candidatus Poribacteria bacterium]
MKAFKFILIIILIICQILIAKYSFSQGISSAENISEEPLMPVHNVIATDTINDDGKSITIKWNISMTDNKVKQYSILRSTSSTSGFYEVGQVPRGVSRYVDEDNVIRGVEYYYIIRAIDEKGNKADSEVSNAVKATAQWFNRDYKFIAIAVVVFGGIIIYCIYSARRGKEFFIRRISGIEAVDEAIGRATEMGRPILYLTGLSGLGDISTLASLNILSRVARKAAEYDTPLILPGYDSFVTVVEREIVKSAHIDAGKPDTYREDNIYFVSDDQFAYVGAVNGIMMREKPAAIFYMGFFYAESLLLAETGNATGAIQIAGTDSDAQLPFFIAACDYTLIGEELYAASAYLAREPLLLGSLKGQDWSKLLLMVAIFLGVLMESFGTRFGSSFFHWIAKFFSER